ncbi:DinB family protein [Siphonobacter sp. SORGH_AS_0500]|uniref:DinB family protein n=1 Tax=Siphonobacter sp. SORGH_AS_0500 TaxID=1864824 RepID=UPI0028603953|nr:DinB family protein [Siphonobacter sp. SORGH_AS_0500]MDR6198036.1 hypothetical protein [Siphonobacter sp. SORGH_AS_0500]
MNYNPEYILNNLIDNLEGSNAHVTFEDAVANLNPVYRTKVYAELPYSIWQLVEHIRIAQWDIVEFSTSSAHQSPQWPEGYWPNPTSEISEQQWQTSLQQIKDDRSRFIDLLRANRNHLFTAFPYGDGQHLFKEALLIIDHTSYHTGEILLLRRLFNNWN